MTQVKRAAHSRRSRLELWADSPLAGQIAPLLWIHKIFRILLIADREATRNRLTLRSGALTYALLLSMVPMLAMSTAVVKGLGGGNQLKVVADTFIDSLKQETKAQDAEPAPDGDARASAPKNKEVAVDLTTHLHAAVDKVFAYVDRTNFTTLGTFGMLGMFLSVILVLGQIETAMNTIWHVEDSRTILRKVADYLTLMVVMPIALNVTLAAGALLKSRSLALQVDRFIPADWIQALLLRGVPILMLTVTLYIIYIFFPNTKLKTVPTLIGALIGSLLWFVTQNLYISLQIGVANYNAIYGSFATIPLFLIWIYLGWLFVLLGAQLAFAIQNCDQYRLVEQTSAPSIQLSGALDVCSLIKARFIKGQGTSLAEIHSALPIYSLDQLHTSIRTLVEAGFIHHVDESGELMPSRPPESITYRQIIEAVLGDEPPPTDGGRVTTKAVSSALGAFPNEHAQSPT